MAAVIPPCPNCGGSFRRAYDVDGLLCKCGLEIDGVMVKQRRCLGQALTVADGTFRALPQSTAGIRVGRQFRDLMADAWFADATPLPRLPDLAAHAIAYGAKLGLRHQSQEFHGQYLVVPRPNGERVQLERDPVYGLCRPHEVLECVERMVDLIADGGPGDWWSLAGAVHAVVDDGLVYWDAFGGEPHLRLRSLGAVDRDASKVKAPTLRRDRGVRVWIKSTRALPDGQLEHGCSETPVDPLDVEYDGVPLCTLLDRDRLLRTDHPGKPKTGDWRLTPLQRAAVSAHWSAELRAKVASSKERERCVVTYCEVDE